MVLYKSKDLSIGAKVEINGEPYSILENLFMNPGRGQAFNKLKLKNIINGSIIIKTIKIGEKLKEANIDLKELKYIYQNDDTYYFYEEKNLEYYEVNSALIKNVEKWLKEGVVYSITFWNNNIMEIKAPRFIDLKVIIAEIFEKKSCVSKNSKYAKLETGNEIKVPVFIKENDIIRIDTEKNMYVSRIN